uniref:Uncharacterized protein n=1 Tax=Strigamia maritima TaxID=126957 RepID=T1IH76_STRMM
MKRVFSWIHLAELKETESRLILRSQAIWFSSEVNRKDGQVSRSSKIIKFRPFLDPNGFLRLGGRLVFALLSPEEKHPIFLHPSSKLTEHIILDSHLETKHGEVGEVLYHLRRKKSSKIVLNHRIQLPYQVNEAKPNEAYCANHRFREVGHVGRESRQRPAGRSASQTAASSGIPVNSSKIVKTPKRQILQSKCAESIPTPHLALSTAPRC